MPCRYLNSSVETADRQMLARFNRKKAKTIPKHMLSVSYTCKAQLKRAHTFKKNNFVNCPF